MSNNRSLTDILSENWGGRTFKCLDTGEEVTLPDTIYRGQFFKVGDGFVDVGDEYYSRWGGSIIEITDK